MSSPTDLELEALQALAGMSQLQQTTSIQNPISDLSIHQNTTGPPAQPAILPRTLFQQPLGLVAPPATREYCVGLNDSRVDEHAKFDQAFCYNTFALFRGKWRSRNCQFDAPDAALLEEQGWKRKKGFLHCPSCLVVKKNMYRQSIAQPAACQPTLWKQSIPRQARHSLRLGFHSETQSTVERRSKERKWSVQEKHSPERQISESYELRKDGRSPCQNHCRA